MDNSEINAQEKYAQMKADKEARLKEYKEDYAEQLRILGYISSLEADNESIREAEAKATVGSVRRRAKKLIKINDKDIKKYQKMLSTMPEVPEFK